MPISSPFDLVLADPVPSSVQWWPLSALPPAGVTLAGVVLLRVPGLTVDVQYDAPVMPQANRLVWRSFTAVIASPEHGGAFPYHVAGLAFVETDGGQQLVGVFPLAAPFDLKTDGDSQEITGFLQVTKYQ